MNWSEGMTIKIKKPSPDMLCCIAWLMMMWRREILVVLEFIGLKNTSVFMGVILFGAIILYLCALHRGSKIETNLGLAILFFMILVFLISMIVKSNDNVETYFREYLIYCFPSALFLLSMNDYKFAVNSFCITSLAFFIMCGFLPFTGSNLGYNAVPYFITGMAYGERISAPCFIGMFLLYKRNNHNKIVLLLLVVCGGIAFLFANRSTLLVIITFIVLYHVLLEKFNGKRLFVLIAATVVVILILYNIETILYFINSMLEEYGYRSYTVTKYINYFISGDLGDSSRSLMYTSAITLFKENPIFGIGIGSFEGSVYAHNFFIDALTSLGILLGIPVIVITLFGASKIITIKEKEIKTLMLILFCMCFPRLLFSKTFFNDPYFWIFVTKALSLTKVKLARINYNQKLLGERL